MDFVRSVPGHDPIVVEGYFAVSPEDMFEAWTTPEIVMKWFGQTPNSLLGAEIDLKIGGSWRFLKEKDANKSVHFEGIYQEIEPARRLAFSWSHVVTFANGETQATPHSLVEVTFSPHNSGTMVYLTHSGISNDQARMGIGGGWEASFRSLQAIL